jgi:predicted ATPase
MLTRLEVEGFKNLLDVQAEFGAFTCIAGANGVGKSNVFDAIEFLSHLASETMVEAAQGVRGLSGERAGDPRDLFWDGYRDHERVMRFAAEMIVPHLVEDDLGAPTRATTTFLRYELSLGYLPPEGVGSIGRLTLVSEELRHIKRGEATKHLRFRPSKSFRDAVVLGERRGGAFLSTEERPEGTVINVHGDGGSRGQPQPRAAARTSRTVLSTVTTNDHPTILAARREMQNWRRLALEPSALRAPDSFSAPRELAIDGKHLAATLHRIAQEADADSGTVDPEAVYARVADRLSDLAGVGVDELSVDLDQIREVFTLFLRERGDLRLPARALSEGTLRFLALCVFLEDPTVTGLICMEEPENGIHPANLPAMVSLVSDLAVDTSRSPSQDNPFRQLIVNTHSPAIVQLCDPADLLLAEATRQQAPDGSLTMGISLIPFQGTWRAHADAPVASHADLIPYLTAPPNTQLQLPTDLVG